MICLILRVTARYKNIGQEKIKLKHSISTNWPTLKISKCLWSCTIGIFHQHWLVWDGLVTNIDPSPKSVINTQIRFYMIIKFCSRLNSTISSQQKLESIEVVEMGQNFFIHITNQTFISLSGAKNISLDNNRIQRIDNDAFSQ